MTILTGRVIFAQAKNRGWMKTLVWVFLLGALTLALTLVFFSSSVWAHGYDKADHESPPSLKNHSNQPFEAGLLDSDNAVEVRVGARNLLKNGSERWRLHAIRVLKKDKSVAATKILVGAVCHDTSKQVRQEGIGAFAEKRAGARRLLCRCLNIPKQKRAVSTMELVGVLKSLASEDANKVRLKLSRGSETDKKERTERPLKDPWKKLHLSFGFGPVFYPLIWKDDNKKEVINETNESGPIEKHYAVYFQLGVRVKWLEPYLHVGYFYFHRKEWFSDSNDEGEFLQTWKQLEVFLGVRFYSLRSKWFLLSHGVSVGGTAVSYKKVDVEDPGIPYFYQYRSTLIPLRFSFRLGLFALDLEPGNIAFSSVAFKTLLWQVKVGVRFGQ